MLRTVAAVTGRSSITGRDPGAIASGLPVAGDAGVASAPPRAETAIGGPALSSGTTVRTQLATVGSAASNVGVQMRWPWCFAVLVRVGGRGWRVCWDRFCGIRGPL